MSDLNHIAVRHVVTTEDGNLEIEVKSHITNTGDFLKAWLELTTKLDEIKNSILNVYAGIPNTGVRAVVAEKPAVHPEGLAPVPKGRVDVRLTAKVGCTMCGGRGFHGPIRGPWITLGGGHDYNKDGGLCTCVYT